MSNREFIKEQERLKAQGKEYVELTPEQKENMLRMEDEAQHSLENSVNKTVIKNLLGQGEADRAIRKEAYNKKRRNWGAN